MLGFEDLAVLISPDRPLGAPQGEKTDFELFLLQCSPLWTFVFLTPVKGPSPFFFFSLEQDICLPPPCE